METTTDELKLGHGRPAMPFADARLLGLLSHTLWFLPNVASCYAMANLLSERQNSFYHAYTVNVAAGTEAGIGVAALEPVERSMENPLESDYREYSLEDVITQLEPKLFRKVTGLNVKDFNLLCSLNVFNASLMNDAVYKFKRYEDASLVYTGLESRHAGENVGLYNTVLTEDEYKELYQSQQETMAM